MKEGKILMDLQNFYNTLVLVKSDINEHLPTLLYYGSMVDHITEMGVRSGRSTTAWIKSAPKKLICYDLRLHPKFNILQYEKWAVEQKIDFHFIVGNTLKVEIEETDLLFIDTLHQYPQLREELRLHADKVRNYIILHDTETFGERGEFNHRHGLKKAIKKFLDISTEWCISEHYANNNGLTILERI